jgi:hypothetical protein
MALVMPGDERRDGMAGVHERLELPQHLAAAHLDGADLGDPAVLGVGAGGLEVHHDEGDVPQRGAELLEGGLVCGRGGAHGVHASGHH